MRYLLILHVSIPKVALFSLIDWQVLNYFLIDDDLVRCPICNAKVRYKRLNAHMDNNCEDPPSADTSKTWSKIMARPKLTATPNPKGKNKYVNKGEVHDVETELSCRKKTSDDDDEDYPLPKASYGTLKDKQLKDMLREYGLPVTGDRPAWEQRHQQCVYIQSRLIVILNFGLIDGWSCIMPIWIARRTTEKPLLNLKRI